MERFLEGFYKIYNPLKILYLGNCEGFISTRLTGQRRWKSREKPCVYYTNFG